MLFLEYPNLVSKRSEKIITKNKAVLAALLLRGTCYFFERLFISLIINGNVDVLVKRRLLIHINQIDSFYKEIKALVCIVVIVKDIESLILMIALFGRIVYQSCN